jgi:hypothetical protein
MSRLLRYLLLFLTLGVGGDGDDAADPPAADAADTDSLEDLLDAADPDPPDAATDGDDAPAPVKAPGRVEKLEAELKQEREARLRAEGAASVVQRAPPAPTKDAQYEVEEADLAKIRAAGNPEAIAWAEWRVSKDREGRENRREAQSARAEARDIADKTAWEKQEILKPNAYKRYNERIEKIIGEQKAAGQTPPPRMALYYFLLGQDADKGAVKTKAKAPTVDRGAMPGTRSDVRPNGKGGGLTKLQKLENELRGKRI